MRIFSSLMVVFAVFVVMAAPWSKARAAYYTVCNKGNTKLYVAKVDVRAGAWIWSTEAEVEGWWTVNINGCTKIHTTPTNNLDEIYLGYSHAGSNAESGAGVYLPTSGRLGNRLARTTLKYKYFCVHPHDRFTYKRSALEGLTKNCPAGAKLMRFSNGVQADNTAGMTVTIVPDINQPVIPFGGPGSSALSTRKSPTSKPKPRTTKRSCEDYEPLFRPKECFSSKNTTQSGKAKPKTSEGIIQSTREAAIAKVESEEDFCPALLKAAREASDKFQKLHGENIRKEKPPLYFSTHTISGFKSCTIGDHGGYGIFVCNGSQQRNNSEPKAKLRDYAKRITKCIGATPTVERKNGFPSYVFDSKMPPEARLTLHLSSKDKLPVLMIFPPLPRDMKTGKAGEKSSSAAPKTAANVPKPGKKVAEVRTSPELALRTLVKDVMAAKGNFDKFRGEFAEKNGPTNVYHSKRHFPGYGCGVMDAKNHTGFSCMGKKKISDPQALRGKVLDLALKLQKIIGRKPTTNAKNNIRQYKFHLPDSPNVSVLVQAQDKKPIFLFLAKKPASGNTSASTSTSSGTAQRQARASRPKTGSIKKCGRYYFYVDTMFLRENKKEFKEQCHGRWAQSALREYYTVSTTPPDADGETITEVKTICRKQFDRSGWIISRDREIPRTQIRPYKYGLGETYKGMSCTSYRY